MHEEESAETVILSKDSQRDQTLFFTSKCPTVKEHSFHTIVEHPGLSCKQVFLLVRKTSTKHVSLQAVHKSLKQLEVNRILQRKGRKYYVNNEWIAKAKKYLEQATNNLNLTEQETEFLLVEIPVPQKNNISQTQLNKIPLNQYHAYSLLF
jgi:hypothetical protein